MDRRYQVFVSSTYVDLVDERREVMQALLEMDCLPAGMEMFPAANEDQWTLIKEVIDQCDFYVVIVGGRYGSVSADGISYTEMEYDYAVESNIPVLGFVHGEPDAIPVGKSELAAEAREKLDAFRDKVLSRTVKKYASPAELGSVVSRGLNRAIRHHSRPGWVRGDQAMTPEVRAEIAELKASLAQAKQDAAEYEFRARDTASALNLEYEHGDDTVSVNFHLSGFYESGAGKYDEAWELLYTWDEIIKTLGPLMIDEASEYALRERWDAQVLHDVKSQDDWPGLRNVRLDTPDELWGEIIVQLRALGVIAIGEKKRSTTDKSVYWKLTPAGDNYLVELHARRRAPHEPHTVDAESESASTGDALN